MKLQSWNEHWILLFPYPLLIKKSFPLSFLLLYTVKNLMAYLGLKFKFALASGNFPSPAFSVQLGGSDETSVERVIILLNFADQDP